MPTIIRFSSSSSPTGPGGQNGPGSGPPNVRTIALAVAALGVGALLLAFGLVLLAAVAAVGVVGGGAVLLYHRLTGRWPGFLHVSTHAGTLEQRTGLDPSREVFPEPPESRGELPPPNSNPRR